jgi:glycosyltransferase involved in cell wall biosynthesis
MVSVIVPIQNEAAFIARSLGAVLAQDYPPDRLEILVVDGMSTDRTPEIVQQVMAERPEISRRLLRCPDGRVATALNLGIAAAQGEIIDRVDGHTISATDYVRECVAALERTGADSVGGRMDAVSEEWFGQAVALATSCRFGVGGARFHYAEREEWVDTVYLGAWPRAVFAHVGFFDEEQVRNQDDGFSYRLRSRGGRIFLSPRIKSRYYNRSSAGGLWRQYFQYGYWKVRVLQKHPRQMCLRHIAPVSFVLALVLPLLLLPFSALAATALGALLAVYFLASMLVYGLDNWYRDGAQAEYCVARVANFATKTVLVRPITSVTA